MPITELGTLPLETERLSLRRFTVGDADAMHANWASDPEVTTFLSWPVHESVAATREVLAAWASAYSDPSFYNWAIQLRDGGPLIGSIGSVNAFDDVETKDVGYCIGRAWWGNGYTAEALRAVVAFLIERVGVNRVESRHDVGNPASGRVMAKAGMSHEGVLRSRVRTNRGIVDASYWAILADPEPEEASPWTVSALRDVSGLTATQLGRLFGVSRRSIDNWMAGHPMAAHHEARLSALKATLLAIPAATAEERRAALLDSSDGLSPFQRLVDEVPQGAAIQDNPLAARDQF